MTGKSWEEMLVLAYSDRHWQEIMDPLCDTFQRWKEGQADRAEVDRVLDTAYRQKCALESLLSQRADRAVAIIEVTDRDWFMAWLEKHDRSSGAEGLARLQGRPAVAAG